MNMREIMNLVEAKLTEEEEDDLSPFATMTRDDFLGKPRITPASNANNLRPKVLKSIEQEPRVPFMRDMTAIYNRDGAAVFDGDKVIASYHSGDTLVVDRRYRRRGIGSELVYQWRRRFPEAKPATHRTKNSHALQKKVWDRIQNEILRKKYKL